MPRRRYWAIGDGFCSVKVKLTKRLAVGAGLLVSAHSIARRFAAGSGEIVIQAASSKVWSSRGKGGCPRPLREKISTDEGGLSQSPPFLLIERIGSLKRFRFFDLEGGKFSVLSHPFSKTVHFFFFRRFGGPKACITLSSFST
jgi:hypothetical protein